MLKNRLKRFAPDLHQLQQYKLLRMFGKVIHDPNLWHFNRSSLAKAFSIGLFFAWVPVPFQMALAAGGAIFFHANLPISVALVWLTNPLTMPPLFLFAYIVGAKILHLPIKAFHFSLSTSWLNSLVADIWQPFLLGCLICGIVSAIVGNIAIRLLWRYFTIKSWHARKNSRHKK